MRGMSALFCQAKCKWVEESSVKLAAPTCCAIRVYSLVARGDNKGPRGIIHSPTGSDEISLAEPNRQETLEQLANLPPVIVAFQDTDRDKSLFKFYKSSSLSPKTFYP